MQRFARGVEVEGSNIIEKLGIDISQLPARKADHGDYEEICQSQSSRGFECYRKEQLAKDLFLGCTGPSILIWGDGGFGPKSHGHASAPNMRLRRLLSKYIPVILLSEYLSSAPAVFPV